MNGKGDKYCKVDGPKYRANHDAIFAPKHHPVIPIPIQEDEVRNCNCLLLPKIPGCRIFDATEKNGMVHSYTLSVVSDEKYNPKPIPLPRVIRARFCPLCGAPLQNPYQREEMMLIALAKRKAQNDH